MNDDEDDITFLVESGPMRPSEDSYIPPRLDDDSRSQALARESLLQNSLAEHLSEDEVDKALRDDEKAKFDEKIAKMGSAERSAFLRFTRMASRNKKNNYEGN
jgi:hypothetical protein